MIDYAVASVSLTTSFGILDFRFESGHAPIWVNIEFNSPELTRAGILNQAQTNSYKLPLKKPSPLPPSEPMDIALINLFRSIKSSRRRINTPTISRIQKGSEARLLRQQSLHLLKEAHTNGGSWSSDNRTRYCKLRNRATAVSRQAKARASAAFADKLISLKSTAEFWAHIKRTMGTKSAKPAVNAEALETHFRQLLTPPDSTQFDNEFKTFAQLVLTEHVPGPVVAGLDNPISPQKVANALEHMSNSSPGEDSISKKDLSALDPKVVAAFFQDLIEAVKVPAAWTRSLLIPIPKPGKPPNKPENLCGISLQQGLRKLFVSCIVPRLYQWAESIKLLQHYQIRFRPGYRTADNIFTLRTLHERSFEKRTLYAVFVDLKTAFDLTDRTLLWAYLRLKGAEGRLIDILKELYRAPTTAIYHDGLFSEFFDVVLGVLQGDPLSPLLFIIFLSALEIADENGDDTTLDGVRIPALMLADDITLLSWSWVGIQKKLRIFEGFCRQWRLIAHSRGKTVAMLLGAPGVEAPLSFCGQQLEYKNEHSVNGFKIKRGVGSLISHHVTHCKSSSYLSLTYGTSLSNASGHPHTVA